MAVVSFWALIKIAGLVVVLVVVISFMVVLAAEVKFIPTTLAIVVLFTMISFLISGVELETSICLAVCGFEVVLKIFKSTRELFVVLVVAAVDVDDDVASVDETVIKVNVVALAFFEARFWIVDVSATEIFEIGVIILPFWTKLSFVVVVVVVVRFNFSPWSILVSVKTLPAIVEFEATNEVLEIFKVDTTDSADLAVLINTP